MKLSWILPVEMSVGHTSSPCWLLVAEVNWKLQPDSATASPKGGPIGVAKIRDRCQRAYKKSRGALVTDVVVPLLTTA